MPLLDIRNLQLNFNIHNERIWALRGVDIQVAQGSRTAIVGESGFWKDRYRALYCPSIATNSRYYRGADSF